MANYATQCRRCESYFTGNTGTDLCYGCLEKELKQEQKARQQAEAEVHKSMEIILDNDFTRDLSDASLHDTVKNICNELEECCCNAANLATSAAKLEQRAKQAEADYAVLREVLLQLLQAIDFYKTTCSPDMGGKHGIVIRVPQGEKGDYWHNAYSAAKAIAGIEVYRKVEGSIND